MSISRDALKESTKSWERLGTVSKGGTVFGLAISPVPEVPRYWAATGCGIFWTSDEGKTWVQSLNGLTTPLLSTMAVSSNGALFAGSLEGDLFCSFNFGRAWEVALVPQEAKATIACIMPSPNFRMDGTVFAATDGGGLLVSRSNGKIWEDSSFGIGSGNVLALASSPDWSKRETMFAATTDGVYVSVNGGRAWRETELMMDDDTIDTLFVSPGFERDRIVYAGTEGGALYRSKDGGRTWDQLQAALGEGSVNCLWLAPDYPESGHMVAGVGARIYISDDAGESWRMAAELPASVLTLAGDDKVLLAGLYDAGVWLSSNRGESWASCSEEFAARGFARIVSSGSKLYAMGPQEGLWVSTDEGVTWQQVLSLSPYYPLTALVTDVPGKLFVASQSSGILCSTDEGQHWTVVCEGTDIQALALLKGGEGGWAGTVDGKLYASQGGDANWQEIASPCEGEEILTIVASPSFGTDHTLLMGTAIAATSNKQARIALWRSTTGGSTWRQVTTQVTTARWVDIAIPMGVTQNAADQAVLVTGPYCLRPLRRAKDVWISTQVDASGANALSVVALGEVDEGGLLFAATGSGVYRSIDGGRTWQSFFSGLSSESFISITASRQPEFDTLFALGLGGEIWKRELR